MTHRLREIEDHEIKEALECPSDFGYSGDNDEMFRTWSLGPALVSRDSDLIAESNSAAMLSELERLAEEGEISEDDWKVVRCRHWGHGWVEHLTFRAVDSDGEPTKVFSYIMEMVDVIQEHVVLDDSDHSRREYEAQLESIENNAPNLIDDLPEDWTRKVFSWLWDSPNQPAFSGDDRTFIAPKYVEEACKALGFAEQDDEDDE